MLQVNLLVRVIFVISFTAVTTLVRADEGTQEPTPKISISSSNNKITLKCKAAKPPGYCHMKLASSTGASWTIQENDSGTGDIALYNGEAESSKCRFIVRHPTVKYSGQYKCTLGDFDDKENTVSIFDVNVGEVDECLRNPCGRNSKCTNQEGGFRCNCKQGYAGDPYKDGCSDVNECLQNPCGKNAECTNLESTYNCKCKTGYAGDPYKDGCSDVNECLRNPCGKNAECRNLESTYECNCKAGYVGNPYAECSECSYCNCKTGYTRDPDKDECTDVNECLQNPCGTNSECTNLEGSYRCNCKTGYARDPDKDECSDVNECLQNPCGTNSECTNLEGSYRCNCKTGYARDPDKDECTDVNECLQNPCGTNSECTNLEGSYRCNCKTGYVRDPDEDGCSDIDECLKEPCGKNAECTNTEGNFNCSCKAGYTGNPVEKCYDIDECLKEPCGENAQCKNTEGNFICTCKEGYSWNPVEKCSDIDECLKEPCGKNAECKNTEGNFICTCKEGYSGNPAEGCSGTVLLHLVSDNNTSRIQCHAVRPHEFCHMEFVHKSGSLSSSSMLWEVQRNDTGTGDSMLCGQTFNSVECGFTVQHPTINFSGQYKCVLGDSKNAENLVAIFEINVLEQCFWSGDCSHSWPCLNGECRDPCLAGCESRAQCTKTNGVDQCWWICPDGSLIDPSICTPRQ